MRQRGFADSAVSAVRKVRVLVAILALWPAPSRHCTKQQTPAARAGRQVGPRSALLPGCGLRAAPDRAIPGSGKKRQKTLSGSADVLGQVEQISELIERQACLERCLSYVQPFLFIGGLQQLLQDRMARSGIGRPRRSIFNRKIRFIRHRPTRRALSFSSRLPDASPRQSVPRVLSYGCHARRIRTEVRWSFSRGGEQVHYSRSNAVECAPGGLNASSGPPSISIPCG